MNDPNHPIRPALTEIAWPESLQLEYDPYWGPKLRAERAREATRRLAIGLAMLAAVAIPLALLVG